MIHFLCPNCKKAMKAGDEHAGRKCKCRHCGEVNTIPGVDGEIEPTVPVEKPIAATPEEKPFELSQPVAANKSSFRFPPPAARYYRGRSEPLYYSFAGFWGSLNVSLGIVGAIVSCATIAMTITSNYKLTKDTSYSIDAALPGLYYLIVSIAYIGVWSFALVGLDAARNVKAIREAQGKN
ncbi:MAG TPA: hypothetical protein PLN21_09950 [Gemmatales bacterium]|nr:hypothetical protein [Gemmatales bacterium]